jgi:hypothetical protein
MPAAPIHAAIRAGRAASRNGFAVRRFAAALPLHRARTMGPRFRVRAAAYAAVWARVAGAAGIGPR